MLADVAPATFDEWEAYRTIHPDRWETLFAILKLGFSAMVNSWGGKTEPDMFDPRTQDKTELDGKAAQQYLESLPGATL